MQFKITRLPSEDRRYSIESGDFSRYAIQAPELKHWLLNMGVGTSTIANVLEIEPNESTMVRVAKSA